MNKLWLALAVTVAGISIFFLVSWLNAGDSDPLANLNQLPAPAAGMVTRAPAPAPAAKPKTQLPVNADPQELQSQLKDVLEQYQAENAYPPDSQPIANAAELQRYLPEQPSSVALPFPVEGQDHPINLSLQLDKYQYFEGDPIVMALSVSGAPANASISASAELGGIDGSRLVDTGLQKDSGDPNLFTSVVRTDGGNTDSWPPEMQVRAYVEVNGNRMLITAPLRFTPPSAIVQGVSESQVQQEYLLIPVQLDVKKAGYFFLGANLYSQKTGAPLVHLEGEGRLGGGTQTLNLHAHVGALKAGGDAGPYWLKDFRVMRGAETGETQDLAGKTTAKAYAVEGFAFDSFTDKPYQDPLAEERQALLSQLGQPVPDAPADSPPAESQ